MADQAVILDVALSDPTTPGQQAAVDASGRLSVSLTASSATVTVDTELPAAAALADAASAAPTTPTIGAIGLLMNATTVDRQRAVVNAMDTVGTGIAAAGLMAQFDDAATGTVTENQFSTVRMSSRRALLVEGVASGTALAVTLTSTTITGTVTVDTELPAAAALADATANPTVPGVGAFAMGYNGTTWDRVRTANTGRLQVDVITGGGTDTPATPITKYATNAAQAAAATFDFDSASQTSATTKLTKVIWSSSVATKAEIKALSNSVSTSYGVGFALAGTTGVWEPPSGRNGRAYMSITFAGAGTNVWRVTVTNRDPSQAADTYCTIFYES